MVRLRFVNPLQIRSLFLVKGKEKATEESPRLFVIPLIIMRVVDCPVEKEGEKNVNSPFKKKRKGRCL